MHSLNSILDSGSGFMSSGYSFFSVILVAFARVNVRVRVLLLFFREYYAHLSVYSDSNAELSHVMKEARNMSSSGFLYNLSYDMSSLLQGRCYCHYVHETCLCQVPY